MEKRESLEKDSRVTRFFNGGLEGTFEKINDAPQAFVISGLSDTVLIGQQGTIILIAENSFIDSKGNMPDKVAIELVEAFTLHEMLRNGLSTTSHDHLLESDGMLYLQATDELGQELKIAAGKEIYLDVPSHNSVPDIQVFKGGFDNDGTLVWRNEQATDKYLSKVPIEQLEFYPEGYKRTRPYYSASSDQESANSLVIVSLAQDNEQVTIDTAFSIDVAVDYCGIGRGLVEMLYQEQFQNTLLATREFETRMQYIHKSCNAEIFKLYLDNINLNLWEIDSMAYEMLLKENNKQANTFKIFRDQRKTKLQEGRAKDSIYASYITKSFDEYEKLKRERNLRNLTMNSFSTTTLGWINCDRFWNDPNAVPIKLEIIASNVAKTQECKTYLVLSSIKSILDLRRYENGVFHVGFDEENTMELPKGEKGLIVSIASNGESPMLGIQEITLGSEEVVSIKLQQVTVEELKRQLSLVNEPVTPAIQNNKAESGCCNGNEYGEKFEVL